MAISRERMRESYSFNAGYMPGSGIRGARSDVGSRTRTTHPGIVKFYWRQSQAHQGGDASQSRALSPIGAPGGAS